MGDWATAKEALATALEAVAVSLDLGGDTGASPFAQDIAHVFRQPPASIEPGLLPCIVLGVSSMSDEWDSAVAREVYELECFLLLRHEDAESAVQLVEAYREDIRDVLRQHVNLGGAAQVVNGAEFGRLSSIGFAGQEYAGFAFTLPIVLSGPVTFAGGA